MYKLTNNPNIVDLSDGTGSIHRGHRLWKNYEDWLADGNIPDPVETDNEIKIRKKEETETLAGEKADALLPQTSDRRKLKQVSRGIKLVFKKIKGTASPQEEAELDALEILDDNIDDIYDAADRIKDEIELDSNYDHINNSEWP